jgi:ABC-type amino acid transport substrate-binding protein
MKKSLIGLFVFAIFIFGYFYNVGFTRFAADNKNMDNFVLGIASGYLPFVGLDSNGNYEGFDIDIAQSLADCMNKKLVLKDCGSMGSLFIALEQNMVDAIMWGLSITQSRLQKIAMVRYYGHDVCTYSLVFWNKPSQSIRSLDDCVGAMICVEAGSVQEKMLDLYPSIKKFSVDRVDDALFNIQYDKADGAFVESVIAKKFKVLFPDNISIVKVPLQKTDCEFGFGIGINQRNTALINTVQDAIAGLRSDGIIDRCAKKWALS